MSNRTDPPVQELLDKPNHAVVSTLNEDGTVHSTVVWQEVVDGQLSFNSSVGRHWPNNLERDPRVTVLVYAEGNPYEYVEIRGTATSTLDGADAQIDRLAKKYLDQDTYPYRQPGEQRVTFTVTTDRVRYAAPG